MSEEELTEIVGLGMIEPHQPQADTGLFDDSAVTIVHRAVRLRNELELDWPGIAVALTLLDENARLTRENRLLQQRPRASSPTDRGDIPGRGVPSSRRVAATPYPAYKLSAAQAGEFPGSRKPGIALNPVTNRRDYARRRSRSPARAAPAP